MEKQRFIVKTRVKFGMIVGYIIFDSLKKINLPYEFDEEEKDLAELKAELKNAMYN